MTGRFDIREHAVRRYIKRHAKEMTFEQAEARLAALIPQATPLRSTTETGDPLWSVSDAAGAFLAVIKPEAGVQVVVTILPAGANTFDRALDDDIAEEMSAAYQRISYLVEARGVKTARAEKDAAAAAISEKLRNQIETLQQQRDALRDDIQAIARSASIGGAAAKRRSEAEVNQLKERVTGLEKRLAKQFAHAELMTRDREGYRKLTAALLRFVMERRDSDSAAQTLVEKIAGIGIVGILDEAFWKRDLDIERLRAAFRRES